MKLSRALSIAMACLAVAACSEQVRDGLRGNPVLATGPAESAVVHARSEIWPAVQAAHRSPAPVGKIAALDLFLFRHNENLSDWVSDPDNRHRALAVGTPERCFYSFRMRKHGTARSAADGALSQCLTYVIGLSEFAGVDCGCRLAVVDDRLLMTPQDLPQERFAPFALAVTEQGGTPTEIKGVASVPANTGTDIPLVFYNTAGKEVCRGRYSVSPLAVLFSNGSYHLSCFDGDITGSGSIRIDLTDTGNPVAVAQGEFSDGSTGEFVIGHLSPAFFAQRRRQLRP